MSNSRPLRVFLCHSSGDKPIVRELYKRLESEGWIDAWLDEEKIYPGENWDLEIGKAVKAADIILVCLSNGSITKEGYVQRELRIVLDLVTYKPEGTLFVIPVRLEDCEPPHRLKEWQYADYFPPTERDKAYKRLLVSLRKRAEFLELEPPAQKGNDNPLPAKSSPIEVKPTSPETAIDSSNFHIDSKKSVHKYSQFGRLTIVMKLSSFLYIPKLVQLDGRSIPIEIGITDVAEQDVIIDRGIISGEGEHEIFVEWAGRAPNQIRERFYASAGSTRVTISAEGYGGKGVCEISIQTDDGRSFVSQPIMIEVIPKTEQKDIDVGNLRVVLKRLQDRNKKWE